MEQPDGGTLSPWWRVATFFVLVLGFAGLVTLSVRAYRDAPPIPERAVDARGETLF